MNTKQWTKPALRWLTAGVGLAATSYATYAALAWWRYGRRNHPASGTETDVLLDRFLADYEVLERHSAHVRAPAETTLSAAAEMDLQRSPIIRAIFRARELILGGKSQHEVCPQPLTAQMKKMGWGVLAERPGCEIVFGAVTRPWEANVVFRSLTPAEFPIFHEPGFVKIAWTLRADPIGKHESVFRSETRAATTDPATRKKFRLYWSFFSAGIVLIRMISLRLVKTEAERRAGSLSKFAGAERRTVSESHPALRPTRT